MSTEPPGEPTTEELSASTAELDVIEAGRGRSARSQRRDAARKASPPQVKLGTLLDGGLAPVVAAIAERGVRRRPGLVAGLNIEVELQVEGPYPPVRIAFSDGVVIVEDGAANAPDLRVGGGLADLVSMMVAPIGVGGLPSLINPRGRAALGKVAFGKVRVEGRLGLMRRMLGLMRI